VHVPALLQTSDVHGLPSLHAAHATPPLPHVAATVPGAHVPPFAQPVQQSPARHFPAAPFSMQSVVFGLLVSVQAPPTQL
jgi:hypothetical protein